MSRGTRTVVNVSHSGATVRDATDEVEAFANDNPRSIENVDKIVFCVGTNEIKWFKPNREKTVHKCFRSPLVNLIRVTKSLFPFAQITFRCVLPIRIIYNYTARAVEQFNSLLFEVCQKYGCIYSDEGFTEYLKVCFDSFSYRWYTDYNADLYRYRDRFHLNDTGIKILCRALKNIIYRNVFNPLPRFAY